MKKHVLLRIWMTWTLLALPVLSAAALPGSFRAHFRVTAARGQPGDTGTAVVYMDLPADSCVGGLSLAVHYDEAYFTVDEASLASALPEAELKKRPGYIQFTWITGALDTHIGGELFRFAYRIAPDTPAEDYTITPGCRELYTPYYEDIPYTAAPGVLTVEDPPGVDAVSVNPAEASLFVGRTLTLTAAVSPAQAAPDIEWQTSDARVASVEDGVVTARREGTAVITAMAGGRTGTCRVTVRANTVTALRISRAPFKTTYYEGESLDLTGLAVTALYADDTAVPVTDYTVTGYRDTTGVHSVVVGYAGQTASFSITVLPQPARTITTGAYRIEGGVLRGIAAQTTVGRLLGNLAPAGEIAVYFENARQSGGVPVKTGMVVQLEVNGTAVHTLNAAVTGDTNGDGAANAIDLLRMKRDLLGIEALPPLSAVAADMNGDGVCNAVDLLLLKRLLLGL